MPLTTTLAGGSAPGFLPFYDPFTRANGPLVAPWQSGGATWTIVSNEVINTPTEGADLVANGDFAAWTGDDPDSWTVTNEDGTAEVSEVGSGQGHGGVGNGLCNIWRQAGGSSILMDQVVATVGQWYLVDVDVDTYTLGTILVRWGNVTHLTLTSTGSKFSTSRATSVTMRFAGLSNSDVTIDNVSAKALALNTLFSNVETGTADVVCQVELDTVVASTQAGLVLNLDDKDTPANFVIAYHDGTNAKLEKCVAGTYTSVISAAAAYAAGATIQITKSGTDYTLTYNSVQVGATSTINDAGIIDNTLHGMFSTYSGNQLDEFRCEKN